MAFEPVFMAQNGPQVSPVIAGMMNLAKWDLSVPERVSWIEACIDMGVTTFDHADLYGSYTCEGLFGEALGQSPSLRDRMQIVTKCGIKYISENRPAYKVKHYDTSTEHILWSADNSLRNLQTDHIDLLLIHRPDALMDADEVADAFTQLRQAGKVAHFGVSNFTHWQFDLLQSRLDFPLVTNQVEFSVMHLDPLHDGTFDQCQQRRIAPMAWSPLAGGSFFSTDDERTQRVHDAMQAISAELDGAPFDQIALAFITRHPARILPVLGTGKLERIQSAVDACQITLTRQQWFTLWQASFGRRVP